MFQTHTNTPSNLLQILSLYLLQPAMVMGLVSSNPVLKNITDYLVDEGSYEEEAYFGLSLISSYDCHVMICSYLRIQLFINH